MKYLVFEVPASGGISREHYTGMKLHELDERPTVEWYKEKLNGGFMERVVPYGWPMEIELVRRDNKTGLSRIRQFEFNEHRREFIIDEDGLAKQLPLNDVGSLMYNWSLAVPQTRPHQRIVGPVLMLINFHLE